MSALSPERDRRGAPRYALPKPVPATLGGFPGNLLEFSLTGCRFEHVDRITLRSKLHLQFSWRGKVVRLMATVMRSEMNVAGKKAMYRSGLKLFEAIYEAPPVIRDIVAWLEKEAAKKSAASAPEPTHTPEPTRTPEPTPASVEDAEELEVLSAPYLQCSFTGGKWSKVYVDKPAQPKDGFTILAPSNESEADVLCRAYATATAEKRRVMRASFEQAITRQKR